MNKRKTRLRAILFLSFLVFLISPSALSSQVKTYYTKKFKPPIVVVELLFSYSQPLPHLYGGIDRFFSFDSYGVKYGFGSQINVKLVTDKKGTIRPYATLGYSLFLGKDNSTAYIDSNRISNGYPLGGNNLCGTVPGKSKMFIHNFNFGFGFEYSFVNKTRWTPFLGADLDMNLLFGTYRQDPDFVRGSATSDEISYTIKEAIRFGFGVGGGVHLRVSRPVGFVFAAKYKFTNVLGKQSKLMNEENKMYLLDKKDTGLNSNLQKDRQIDYLEFMLGIAFYIGKK